MELDKVLRKNETARALGISGTSLWRIEKSGELVSIAILPGVSGFRASEVQRYIESRARVAPDRSRVAAALASPRHGRAGRAAQGAGNAA